MDCANVADVAFERKATDLSSAATQSPVAGSPRMLWADLSDESDDDFEIDDGSSARQESQESSTSWNAESYLFEPKAEEEPSRSKLLFTVQLEGIPQRLCSDACLEAMLQTSGLDEYELDLKRATGGGGGRGVATVRLPSWHAAVRCYNHFTTSSWAAGSLKVSIDGPEWQHPTSSFAWSAMCEADMYGPGYYDYGADYKDAGNYCAGMYGMHGAYYCVGSYQATSEAHETALALARSHAKQRARAASCNSSSASTTPSPSEASLDAATATAAAEAA